MKKTITLVLLAAFLMCVLSVTAITAMDSVPVLEEMSGGSIEVMSNESVVTTSEENAEEVDYANLQISPRYEQFRIKPGGEKEFTVKVKNKENESVFTSPRLETMLYSEYFMKEEWITIEPGSAEIESEEVQEYTVTVKIPEDAEIGDYGTQIVFTNDTISMPYLPFPTYQNSLMLSIDVWEPSKIVIQPWDIDGMVEAGQTKEYQIQIENKGDEAIAISPEIGGEEYMYDENMIPNEWLTVDAPATVDANSTATVNVTVDVPADAAKGKYGGGIKLNIDDSAAERWGRDYEVHIRLEVWKQPKTAYPQNFTVKQGQNFSVVITTSQRGYDKYATGTEETEEPSFNVSLALAGLEGEDMTPEPSKTVNTVGVSLGSDYLPLEDVTSEETYHVSHIEYSETYMVTNATGGVWTLKILPRNTQNFEYTIEIGG